MSQEKVRVRFITKYEEFRISDAPFAVPSDLNRAGLSEVVNHLLGSSDVQPFDFLIDSRLLRTTLSKFMKLHRITSEGITVIEYMPAVTLSDETNSSELPAWVGAIDCSLDGLVVTGCFDGKVQILNDACNTVGSIAAHEDPIRAIASLVPQSASPYFPYNEDIAALVFTGSKDQSIKAWAVGASGSSSHVATFSGHVNSVECLDVWKSQDSDRSILVSGDWSGNVFGWDLNGLLDGSEEAAPEAASSKKRSKTSAGKARPVLASKELKPIFTIRAHAQSVSGIQSCSRSGSGSSRVVTGSWDHSIKEWDLEHQDCVATLAGSKVITSVHCSPSSSLIASSHCDGKVRLWDTRQTDQAACIGAVGSSSKTQWISQVRWCPGSATLLAATDYNGAVKLWDTRAGTPLGSSDVHDGKALCVDWKTGPGGALEGSRMYSGGADCFVKSQSLSI